MKSKIKNFTFFFFVIVGLLFSCTESNEETMEITVSVSAFVTAIDPNPNSGLSIGTIDASTNQGSLTYSIIEQSPSDAIAIDSSTGELTVLTKSLFDFQINPYITGIIKADNGEVSDSASFTIHIRNTIDSQIYKRITDTTDEFVIDFYVLLDSVEDCNIIPYEQNFTGYGGGYGYYSQEINGKIVHRRDWKNLESVVTNLTNLNLESTTFIFPNPKPTGKRVSIIGTQIYEPGTDNKIGFENSLPITTDFFYTTAHFESIGSPPFFQIASKRIILKKQLNDGTRLPIGLWFSTLSPRVQISVDGQLKTIESKGWFGKFNGETWVEQELDIYGNEIEEIVNICN